MTKEIKITPRIVIDRIRWNRGLGSDSTVMADAATGKLCIMGFACLRAGVALNQLERICDPEMLNRIHGIWLVDFLDESGDLADWIGTAMNINDNVQIDDRHREKELISLFQSRGFDLRFSSSANKNPECTTRISRTVNAETQIQRRDVLVK